MKLYKKPVMSCYYCPELDEHDIPDDEFGCRQWCRKLNTPLPQYPAIPSNCPLPEADDVLNRCDGPDLFRLQPWTYSDSGTPCEK